MEVVFQPEDCDNGAGEQNDEEGESGDLTNDLFCGILLV
jgi:hypothetical protein